jgi:cytochrome c biogenesis protein
MTASPTAAADQTLLDADGRGRLAMGTQPVDPDAAGASRQRRGLRYWWRKLTSMRTALLLLSLLALAAVPGSLLPQRGINPARVAMFLSAHRTVGPVLDRLSAFDVFAAPWFAAIYLLLLVSLIGCLIPRIRLHVRALRLPLPATPRHLDRLGAHAIWRSDTDSTATVALLARRLRRRRWRVVTSAGEIRAERGYLRETGNLLFHVCLLLLLAGVAWGALDGYQADVVVVDGQGFSNTPVAYDTFEPGRAVQAAALPPFSVHLNRFSARYLPSGEAASYDAYVTWQPAPDAAPRRGHIWENHPLVTTDNPLTGGTKVYLTGHGFAPQVTVTSRTGRVLFDGTVPFLPTDAATYTSTGVIKVPAGAPDQLGFSGFLLPTAQITPLGMGSSFPAPDNPRLILTAYHGDLGLASGRPQSVYTLDTARMTQYVSAGQPSRAALAPGQQWRLPDGTTLRFDALKQFANFHVTYNPGTRLVLLSTVLLIAGLIMSLTVRRQRLWLRVRDDDDGSRVSAGALSRTDNDRFHDEFARLVLHLSLPASKGRR